MEYGSMPEKARTPLEEVHILRKDIGQALINSGVSLAITLLLLGMSGLFSVRDRLARLEFQQDASLEDRLTLHKQLDSIISIQFDIRDRVTRIETNVMH
jgi:hypothetical protein